MILKDNLLCVIMDENGSSSSQLTQNKEKAITGCQDALCIFTFTLPPNQDCSWIVPDAFCIFGIELLCLTVIL